ncbi:MAG: formyltransferase family protein [Candidatus Liptonbacteria bacterium]|nr:formyltransferase family protein [Candidatus Liptonbacteria bacterium]
MLNGKLNLAGLISGGGTTWENVLRGCKNGHLSHVNPALVISSRPDAGGIEKARRMRLPEENIVVIVRKNFDSPYAYGEAILHECRMRGVDLIAQCGFIPTMPANVIAAYEMAIFNQHPGPLDHKRLGFGGKGMRGLAVHAAVVYFAQRVGRQFMTEATVHRVTNVVDGGAILGIRPMEIWKEDLAEKEELTVRAKKLAARILPYEHNLVVETILQFSEYGGPHEIEREIPLIWPGEESLLKEAIAAGIVAYPNG